MYPGVFGFGGMPQAPQLPAPSFQPYPTNIDGLHRANGEQDHSKLLALLNQLPPVAIMAQQASDSQLKVRKFHLIGQIKRSSHACGQVFLDDIDELLYPLLQWILKTTRSTINLIADSKRIKVRTWVFLLCSLPICACAGIRHAIPVSSRQHGAPCES